MSSMTACVAGIAAPAAPMAIVRCFQRSRSAGRTFRSRSDRTTAMRLGSRAGRPCGRRAVIGRDSRHASIGERRRPRRPRSRGRACAISWVSFASAMRSMSVRMFSAMSSAVRAVPVGMGSSSGFGPGWDARSMPLPAEKAQSARGRQGEAEPILRPMIDTAVGGLPERRAADRAAASPAFRAAGGKAGPHAPRPRSAAGPARPIRRRSARPLLLHRADAARRPCNACRGCRDGRARVHPTSSSGRRSAWREQRATGESIVASAGAGCSGRPGHPDRRERRVVLIEHADQANEQTQNALLKALEEPSGRHTFVLCRRRARAAAAHDPVALPAAAHRAGRARRAGRGTSWIAGSCRPIRPKRSRRLSSGCGRPPSRYAERRDVLDWRRRVQAELLVARSGGAAPIGSAPVARPPRRGGAPRRRHRPRRRSRGAGRDGLAPASAQRGAAIMRHRGWLALTRDLLVAAAGRPMLAPSSELAPEIWAPRPPGSAPRRWRPWRGSSSASTTGCGRTRLATAGARGRHAGLADPDRRRDDE